MSALSSRLAGRRVTIPEPGVGHVLSELAPGSTARIEGFATSLPASTCRRLFDLGFTPGAGVEVVRKAPAQDPVIYRVAGCEIAIRRSLARGVCVSTE